MGGIIQVLVLCVYNLNGGPLLTGNRIMRQFTTIVMFALVGLLSFASAFATPPTVVKSVPIDGATDVDPGLTEIRITFDQPMDPRGFSFVGGGETWPGTPGTRPRWVDDRTCALPVTLRPKHNYSLGVNNQTFTNFRSVQGEAAVPFPLSFTTAASSGGGAERILTKEDNDKAIVELKRLIDQDYSYLDVHKVDWQQAFSGATSKLEAAQTPMQFAREAGKLLAQANDMHIWLKVGQTLVPVAIRRVDPNCNIKYLAGAVPGFTAKNHNVAVGAFDGGVAYVNIASFSGGSTSLDAAMDALADAKAVIVDVRLNSGGNELLAAQFAGCFVSEDQVYARDIRREAGRDLPTVDRVLHPNSNRPRFTGKVALLIGPENMSSCESFIMMMKTSASCTTIGEKTYGSSGNPHPHDLGNGVTLYLPSWRDLRLDGTSIETEGLPPDVEVKGDRFDASDPVLDRALQVLGGK
jgi:Peptidase family S41/Bacterial Ig-like domain